MARGYYSPMHQDIFGSAENPFSLVADPKYFFRSASHGSVFDQLHDAIRRRDGFVLVTGEVGSGKTTVCRAVLEQLDRKTFTSLIQDPSLSEGDLLRAILQDFGLVSRDEMKRGRLAHASQRELIHTLDDFLASLRPLGAAAVLVIDEAQDMPLETLEQIAALAGPGGAREKLLQIVLVGQPILKELLRSPLVRELDGRISTRLELNPLTAEETSEYISHRLMVAGAGPARFAPAAVTAVHRYSGGVPRLINMVCDGALLEAGAQGATGVTPQVVDSAAGKLELRPVRSAASSPWSRKPAVLAAVAIVLVAVLVVAYLSVQRSADETPASTTSAGAAPVTPSSSAPPSNAAEPAATPAIQSVKEPVPPAATESKPVTGPSFSVLVASFRQASEAAALQNDLRNRGLPVQEIRVVSSPRGVWHQVLVGPYPDAAAAARGQERVRQIRGYADARVVPG